MLLLTSTADRLQVVTANAAAIDVHASWVETGSTGTITPGRTNTAITTATTTSIAGIPTAAAQRNIKTLHIRNKDTALTGNVIVQHTNGSVTVQLFQALLFVNDSLEYTDQGGFSIRSAAAGGTSGATGTTGGGGGFTTGDGKVTLKIVAEPGWVMCNDGTIGSAASGSTNRANVDCQALFTLLFQNVDDTGAPIYNAVGTLSSRGAQGPANVAWANDCRIGLPKQLGRAIAIAGTGAGLSLRNLGYSDGAETHSISGSELTFHGHSLFDPSHAHTLSDPTHAHSSSMSAFVGADLSGGQQYSIAQGSYLPYSYMGTTSYNYTGMGSYGAYTGITGVGAAGGSAPMNILNPRAYWNVMLKL